MKRTSKFLSLLLVLSLVCGLFVPAMAVVPSTDTDLKGKLIILHTNDTHGGDVASEKSIGTAGVAQLKKDYEAAGADVLLFSAGDAIQGAPVVNYDKGASEVKFMNAAGYDAMAPGNHEFDWGLANLQNALKGAKFPVLSANIVDKATNKPVFEANKIFTTKSGLKVGVFGLDTPETATKTNPKNIETIKFLGVEDNKELYDCAQAQVKALEEQKCDLIICVGHLGISDESVGKRSIDVAKNVTGIDLFIDGHSHSTNEEIAEKNDGSNLVNDTLIVSTGTKLAHVGVVSYDAGKLDFGYVDAGTYTETDSATAKLVDAQNAVVTEALKKVVGKTEVLLDGEREPGVRTQETNLGDFSCDAILWQARKELGEDAVDGAFTNGGGIRASIPVGDISLETMATVFPYGNTIATVDITGAQLLEMLEANTYSLPDSIGGFPQVAGITYTVDTSVKYENGAQYEDSTYFAPAKPGSRVTDVTVNGKALDLKETYTLATNDFTAVGGDAYGVLTKASKTYVSPTPLEDALINYMTEVLGGTVTAEKYGESAGRITIKASSTEAPATPATGADLSKYTDLTAGAWYTDAVSYVVEKGTMSGTSATTFAPAGTVSRATVYQTLYNLEGKPAVTTASVTDVTGQWYADAINWAASKGLYEGTTFGQDAAITRSGIATIIADYAEMKGVKADTSGMAMKEAPDYESIPTADLEGMTFCFYANVMKGDQNGNLKPAGDLTRAEFAQVLKNFDQIPA